MEITITKGAADDRIIMRRGDGSAAETRFPKKGPVPHDAVHWFVERELKLDRAFWGMVSGGAHPEELAALAREAGHASAKRAGTPAPHIVQLLQAERLVECFEAELWALIGTTGAAAGDGSDEALLAVAGAACAASQVPLPAIPPGAVAAIRRHLGAFAAGWIAAPTGHVAEFTWEEC